MSVFDPMNLYIGSKVGDLVHIERDDSIQKSSSTHICRLVIDSDYFELGGVGYAETNEEHGSEGEH